MKLFSALLPIIAHSKLLMLRLNYQLFQGQYGNGETCMNQWEDQISSLLDETQALVSSVEAAVIDGLTGSYVSRISMALNNVEENLESCPILNDLADQVERIKEFL